MRRSGSSRTGASTGCVVGQLLPPLAEATRAPRVVELDQPEVRVVLAERVIAGARLEDPEIAVAGGVPPVEGGVAGLVGLLEPAGDDRLAAGPRVPGLGPVDAVVGEEGGDRLGVVRLPGGAVGVDPAA